MWRPEVLQGLAARSAPGARAATFTVAGHARRGLAAAGFSVAKRPGFGRKRERLEAQAAGAPAVETGRLRVAVVGAGVAGASVAAAVRRLGGTAQVFDFQRAGAGASGNPAALVTPRLDAGLGPPARAVRPGLPTRAAAVRRNVRRGPRAAPCNWRGRADSPGSPRSPAPNLFADGELRRAPWGRSSDRGAPGRTGGRRAQISQAPVIAPAALLEAWCGEVTCARVSGLRREAAAWMLIDAAGEIVAHADAVVLAAARAPRSQILWP